MLTRDAAKTSGIEGEWLDPDQVRASRARRLGKAAALGKKADAIAGVELDATQRLDQPRMAGYYSFGAGSAEALVCC